MPFLTPVAMSRVRRYAAGRPRQTGRLGWRCPDRKDAHCQAHSGIISDLGKIVTSVTESERQEHRDHQGLKLLDGHADGACFHVGDAPGTN